MVGYTLGNVLEGSVHGLCSSLSKEDKLSEVYRDFPLVVAMKNIGMKATFITQHNFQSSNFWYYRQTFTWMVNTWKISQLLLLLSQNGLRIGRR